MAKICRSCGAGIDDSEISCPICQQPVREAPLEDGKLPGWLANIQSSVFELVKSAGLVFLVMWWLCACFTLTLLFLCMTGGWAGLYDVGLCLLIVAPGIWFEPVAIVRGQSTLAKKKLTLGFAAVLALWYMSAVCFEDSQWTPIATSSAWSDDSGSPRPLKDCTPIKT